MLKFCSPIPVPPFIVCYLSCLIWLALFSSLAIIFDLSSLSPPSLTFLLRSLLSPFAPHVERLPPPRPPPGSVISGRRKNEAVIGKWMSSANFPSAELTPAATGRRVGGGNNFRVSKGVCRQGPILLSLPLCLFTNFPQIICFRTPPPLSDNMNIPHAFCQRKRTLLQPQEPCLPPEALEGDVESVRRARHYRQREIQSVTSRSCCAMLRYPCPATRARSIIHFSSSRRPSTAAPCARPPVAGDTEHAIYCGKCRTAISIPALM